MNFNEVSTCYKMSLDEGISCSYCKLPAHWHLFFDDATNCYVCVECFSVKYIFPMLEGLVSDALNTINNSISITMRTNTK